MRPLRYCPVCELGRCIHLSSCPEGTVQIDKIIEQAVREVIDKEHRYNEKEMDTLWNFLSNPVELDFHNSK